MQGMLFLFLSLAAWSDRKTKKVPAIWLYGGMILFTAIFLWQLWRGEKEMADGILGVLPSFLCICLAKLKQGMGEADGMIVYILGLTLGIQETIQLLTLAFFIVGIISVILLFCKKVKAETEIAFVPFLWLAYLLRIL